jgi:hypothetical protein
MQWVTCLGRKKEGITLGPPPFPLLWVCFTLAAIANAHSLGENLAQQTKDPGVWVDPSTMLMWAAKDNGRDVNWREAAKYCRELRLAGFSDWRLATVEELEALHDNAAKAPGLGAGKKGSGATTWPVKGNLFLTGNQWSSSQRLDSAGRPSGLFWCFNFRNRVRISDDGSRFSGRFAKHGKRALCVRQSGL